MQLVSDITRYVTIFFIMIVVLSAIIGALAYYLLKVKKIASKEEQFDYTKFERRDSVEYIRFDQIINAVENGVQTKNGIIVCDGGTRFIAGLKVSGFNFFSASAQEQGQSMRGMIAFLNTVEGDVQYRQSTKAIDLSFNIEEHRKRIKEVGLEIYGLQMDHEELVAKAEDYLDNPKIFANYEREILAIERTIKCKQHTQQELEIVVQYMEALSDNNVESEKVQCWFYEWVYNPNEYTEQLSVEEQYEKAAESLSTKANSYISSLQRTGCTCERLTGDEMLELFRYHYSPITADVYKTQDLYNSSYTALFVSSDSLDQLDREAEDEVAYRNLQKELYEEQVRAEQLEKEKAEQNAFSDSIPDDPAQEDSDSAPVIHFAEDEDDGDDALMIDLEDNDGPLLDDEPMTIDLDNEPVNEPAVSPEDLIPTVSFANFV